VRHARRQGGEAALAEPSSRFTALFEALAIEWLKAASQKAVAGLLKSTTYVGTGIRSAPAESVAVFIDGASVPVLYGGAQPEWDGLDQINIELPLWLRGAGQVDVVIEAGGILSNTARIQII
jgi:uncharacterized protein (TIGR03437 family)